MARQHRTPVEMYPVIESYLESGLTQRVFCRQQGLSMQVFAYWLAKYRREQKFERAPSEGNAFIELAAPAGGSDAGGSERAVAELVYPNGVRLRLFDSVGVETIAQLVASA
jgi:hypothetical protein